MALIYQCFEYLFKISMVPFLMYYVGHVAEKTKGTLLSKTYFQL